MNAVSQAGGRRRVAISIPCERALPVALVLAALSATVAGGLLQPLDSGRLLAAGVALLGVLMLTLVRYEAAVALGFVLIGVALVEPAPADLVFFVVIAVAVVTGRFEPARVPAVILALIAAFLALNIASMIEAVEPGTAASFFAITLYLAVFALWFAGYVRSARRARGVALAYVAAAVGSALVGTLALLTPLGDRELLLSQGADRAKALFDDPNVFGPFLVPAALLVLEEIMRSPRRRVVKVLMLLVLVLGILFSYSRAAWLNFAVAIVVMLGILALRRRGGRRAAALLALLLASAVAAMGVVATTGSVAFLEQRAQLQSYDVERFGAQETGVELAESYPLGVGPGQFESLAGISSHNTYVRALAEQGVLGLAAIVGLTLGTLGLAARNTALGRDTYGIGSAVLLGAWCGIVVNSLFVDTLHWRHMWVVAALVWAGTTRPRRGLASPHPRASPMS